MPFPVPVFPAVIDSQSGSLVLAVHVQDACVVTVTLSLPAEELTVCFVGESVKLHGGPAWVMVNVSPAMVTVPFRALPVFAATAMFTDPLPCPAPLPVTSIHGAPAVAVHAQFDVVVTRTETLPPWAGMD